MFFSQEPDDPVENTAGSLQLGLAKFLSEFCVPYPPVVSGSLVALLLEQFLLVSDLMSPYINGGSFLKN